MCRPSRNQREVYSGHKRCHGSLKYQSVSSPCGLIVDLYGPVPGRRHDMHLLRESRIVERLREVNVHGTVYRVYGDPAYPITDVILRAFRGLHLTPVQREINREFNAMRTSNANRPPRSPLCPPRGRKQARRGDAICGRCNHGGFASH